LGLEVLEYQAHIPRHLRGPALGDVSAQHHPFPFQLAPDEARDEGVKAIHEGGLASPGVAHPGYKIALLYLQGDVIQSLLLRTLINEGQVFELDGFPHGKC